MLERYHACARWRVAVPIFLAKVVVSMEICARARPFQRGSIVLLDLLEAELRCFKADPKSSIRSIGVSIRLIGTDGSSHTLGPITYIGTINDATGLLLSSGRQDEQLTVGGETNTSLVVDSVRLLPVFQARKVVVDGEK